MLAQSGRGIRRTMISVSRRVGSFQISRNRPSRTPSKTRAAALFGLKPAATNTSYRSRCLPRALRKWNSTVETAAANRSPSSSTLTIGVPGFTMAAWVASSARVHRVHLRRGTEGSNPAPSAAVSSHVPPAPCPPPVTMARTEEPIAGIMPRGRVPQTGGAHSRRHRSRAPSVRSATHAVSCRLPLGSCVMSGGQELQ